MYHVLIVEDEPLVRLGLRSMLDWEGLGFQLLDDAVNGKQALSNWDQPENYPDIVITDIRMPVIDGLEMIKQIRARDVRCKFIILSNIATFEHAQNAISLGVSEYLLKISMTKDDILRSLLNVKQQLEKEDSLLPSITVEKQEMPSFSLQLQEYFNDPSATLEKLERTIALGKCSFYMDNILVAAMRLEYGMLSGETAGGTDKDFIERAFFYMLQELIARQPGCWILKRLTMPSLIVMTFDNKKSNEDAEILAHQILSYVRETIHLYFNDKILCGMSDMVSGLENLRTAQEQADEDLERSATRNVHCVIRQVIMYLKGHYTEKLTLDQIANTVGYSASHLSAMFSKEMGVCIFEYLNGIRIEKAKIMLEQTRLFTYEISQAVGFASESYFCRMFRKLTQMTPNKYRHERE